MKSISNSIIIEPRIAARDYWSELWRYRELFLILAWRDITVRYKQTVLGVLWALVQPLLTMMVFAFIFGRLARMPSGVDAPYTMVVLAGLLPWQLFSTAVSNSSASLLGNANLISKIYFPRLLVPVASIAVAFVDFLIALVLVAFLMVWYAMPLQITILALPVFVLLTVVGSLGLGLWLASWNVKYRDFKFLVPFLMQIGLYFSPVGFVSSNVPSEWRYLYALNPMVGAIDGFRWSIIGQKVSPDPVCFLISASVAVTLLFTGLRQFRSTERYVADLI